MKGKTSLFVLIMGFILYVMDIISDIYVAFQYYKNGEFWWCGITLVFVFVPHVIINTCAAYINVNFLWVSTRNSFLMWIFQISIVASFKQEFTRWKREHWKTNTRDESSGPDMRSDSDEQHTADVTLTMHHTFLCLAEAFSESAPQCCLQNYIMIRQWYFPWYTVLSTALSLISLAWSITSLEMSCKNCQWTRSTSDQSSPWIPASHSSRSQWLETQHAHFFPKISLVVFLVAHLCLLVSRLAALVIFAYVFRYFVFIIVGVHWLIIFTAICVSKKFDQSKLTLILNASLRAYPMVFCLSSSIAKMSFPKRISESFRLFGSVFYGVFIVENAAMVFLAVISEAAHINFLAKITLPLVFVGFTLGVLSLLLYYQSYHPGKIATQHNVESTTLRAGTCPLEESRRKEEVRKHVKKYFVNKGTCYEDMEHDI